MYGPNLALTPELMKRGKKYYKSVRRTHSHAPKWADLNQRQREWVCRMVCETERAARRLMGGIDLEEQRKADTAGSAGVDDQIGAAFASAEFWAA